MVSRLTQGISFPCPYVKGSQTPADLKVSNEPKWMQATKAENRIAQIMAIRKGNLDVVNESELFQASLRRNSERADTL